MDIIRRVEPTPDYRNLVLAASNQWAPRLPLYEHSIGAKVIYELTGTRPYDLWFSKDMRESRQGFAEFWDFWRKMGYDTAQVEFSVCGILPGGGALGRHQPGAIKNRADFERYPWTELPGRFFEAYAPYIRNLAATCPPGMKAVGGVGNGLFEAVQDIVGYMDLCYIRGDDPELYADLFRAMGDTQAAIWRRMLDEFGDVFCVLRFGDDLGFNTMTLLPPDDIRAVILPQYRRITDLVHEKGKPFLLHSCGNLFAVFDDIINIANIDAKHSNEDNIAHFTEWVDRYGGRIGNFGGIDTDVLCRYDAQYIREYILDCLEKVKGKGGIAFSSGNSIPDYVPTEGYAAMIETVRSWRGESPD
ncbi:MAG TPA: uroporphyrinogen decarboxylase family protein [Clostridia bacterium]|nr:uroporphyrinogen decarboxylase family protein [Clostridia bacterium]